MNPQLNKQLHSLLNATDLTGQKSNIVHGFTDGRSDSSKELTNGEAEKMIKYLQSITANKDEVSNKMRRKMISLAHEMHWHLPGTQKIDMQQLNGWCCKFGQFKKELNKHSYDELTKLVSQFNQVYNHFLKKI